MRSCVRWTVSFSFLLLSNGFGSGLGCSRRIGVTTSCAAASFVVSAVRSGMRVANGSFLMVLLAVCGLVIDDALTCFLGDDLFRELPVVLGPVAGRGISRDGAA